jgi:hypothetical protein
VGSLDVLGGNVLDIRPASRELLDLVSIDVHAQGGHPVFCKCEAQRQADIAQADHSD